MYWLRYSSTPLIISYRLPVFLESLMPLKNWCSIHARCPKRSLKHSIHSCGIFSKFKTEFYCISFFLSVLTSRLHFWNSPAVTIRVYSNCCCSCRFKPEIIKIRQSSHDKYSNKILNYQESTTILNGCTKSLETYWRHHAQLSGKCWLCGERHKTTNHIISRYRKLA